MAFSAICFTDVRRTDHEKAYDCIYAVSRYGGGEHQRLFCSCRGDAETNGEAGITEGSVAETADDEADDDETTVAEITADDDEAAIDETAVVEITDAAAADDEAAAAETADDEVADGEAAVVEITDAAAGDENVVQAIWTRGNSTITFYYGPTGQLLGD